MVVYTSIVAVSEGNEEIRDVTVDEIHDEIP